MRDQGGQNPLDRAIVAIARRSGSKALEVERFLRFAFVGLAGSVVDLGTLTLLQATLLPPSSTSLVALATTIAFFAAIINNFLWNRFWTYPDSRSRSLQRQLLQFTLVSLVGWVLRTLWISAAYASLGATLMPMALPLVRVLRPGYVPSVTFEGKLGTLVAWVVGIIVVMMWNFFANRYWTFSDVDKVSAGRT